MADYIEWLRLLINNHRSIEYLIILVVTILGGEVALFVIGFLIAQGLFPFFSTIIISFVGAFLPNVLWFLLGNTKFINKTAGSKYGSNTFDIITETITRVSRGSHLLALIIIKFLVGTPVLLVMYAQKTALTFRKFLYYQVWAILLSVLVVVSTGYIGGKGFDYIKDVSQNVYSTIGFIVCFTFLVILAQVWFEKFFTKENIDKK